MHACMLNNKQSTYISMIFVAIILKKKTLPEIEIRKYAKKTWLIYSAENIKSYVIMS